MMYFGKDRLLYVKCRHVKRGLSPRTNPSVRLLRKLHGMAHLLNTKHTLEVMRNCCELKYTGAICP